MVEANFYICESNLFYPEGKFQTNYDPLLETNLKKHPFYFFLRSRESNDARPIIAKSESVIKNCDFGLSILIYKKFHNKTE